MIKKLRELLVDAAMNILLVIAFIIIGLYALGFIATFIMFPFALFGI